LVAATLSLSGGCRDACNYVIDDAESPSDDDSAEKASSGNPFGHAGLQRNQSESGGQALFHDDDADSFFSSPDSQSAADGDIDGSHLDGRNGQDHETDQLEAAIRASLGTASMHDSHGKDDPQDSSDDDSRKPAAKPPTSSPQLQPHVGATVSAVDTPLMVDKVLELAKEEFWAIEGGTVESELLRQVIDGLLHPINPRWLSLMRCCPAGVTPEAVLARLLDEVKRAKKGAKHAKKGA